MNPRTHCPYLEDAVMVVLLMEHVASGGICEEIPRGGDFLKTKKTQTQVATLKGVSALAIGGCIAT